MHFSVCKSVPKNLANCSTDMILHYSVASHRSWENLSLVKETVSQPYEEMSPIEKI